MSGDTEFSGRPLAIGSVRGVRSFNVDDLGRLHGVTYPAVWQPGENQAECLRGSQADPMAAALQRQIAMAFGGAAGPLKQSAVLNRTPTHGLDECGHGFYGYYDGSDDYHREDRITAVVEGWGETVIGTRGFRCSTARILALHIPTAQPDGEPLVDEVLAAPRRFGLPTWAAWSFGCGFGGLLQVGLRQAGDGRTAPAVVALALAGISAAAAAVLAMRRPKPLPPMRFVMGNPSKPAFVVSGEVVERVRRNYPDVAVFGSFDEMVAAYPPDRQLTPSPDSDADFWTR